MSASKKRLIFKIITIVFLAISCLIVVYPLIYTISVAFSDLKTASNSNIVPFKDGFGLTQFDELLYGKNSNFFTWIENTFIIAATTCIATVIVASLSAYVFSRFKFAFRRGLMMSLLVLQIFPSFVGMIAIFVILNRIHAYDTLWGIVLVYVAGNIPYNTWLVKSYLDTIPKSLDEAARIDGANHLTIFFRVVLPIAKPILIFLSITSFTGPWMDWIFPKLALGSKEKETLAIGLIKYIDGTKNQFTTFAAGAVLVAVPFIIFFVLSQKSMVTSLGGAAVKE